MSKECQDQNIGVCCLWYTVWPSLLLCSAKGLEVFNNFILVSINLLFSHKYRRLLIIVNNWSNLSIIDFLNPGLKPVCLPGKFLHLNSTISFLLLNSNHEKWRSRRRLITPSFHDTHLLHNFMHIFNEQACILARRLDEYTKQPNQTYDLYPYISACTLDIIAGLLNCLLKNVSDFIV
jgi:hypothetical protein